MASLRDGLGGEELAISGLQAGGVSISPYIIGSLTVTNQLSGLNVFAQSSGLFTRVTATNLIATTDVSGLNLFAQGSVVVGRVENTDGAIFTAGIGSPGNFGAIVQAGSNITGAGSTVNVPFRRNFTNVTDYVITFSPRVTTADQNAGSYIFYVSGTSADGKRTSGCFVVGPASAQFNWIAVGI